MTASAMLIIGAGECGTRAAFALREEGWDGRIILVGAELAPPYERPPLSKIWGFKPLCDNAMLWEADITLLCGTEATGLDTAAHVLELAGGRRLPYQALLLATGARARRLPVGGARVHMLRTCSDAAALRGRLASGVRVGVIGGGFIGLELASSAAALGCAVTVIELGPRLVGRAVPALVAATVANGHVAAGSPGVRVVVNRSGIPGIYMITWRSQNLNGCALEAGVRASTDRVTPGFALVNSVRSLERRGGLGVTTLSQAGEPASLPFFANVVCPTP